MQYLAFRNLLHKQNIKDRKGSFVRQPAMLEGQPTWHFLVYFQKEYWKWCMMEQEVDLKNDNIDNSFCVEFWKGGP